MKHRLLALVCMYLLLAKGSTEDLKLKSWVCVLNELTGNFFPNTLEFSISLATVLLQPFPLNGHSLMLLVSFKGQSRVQYFCPVSWQWISKQDAYFSPHYLQQWDTENWAFVFSWLYRFNLVIHSSCSYASRKRQSPGSSPSYPETAWELRSESTPSPTAGTLSKKRGIGQNTS